MARKHKHEDHQNHEAWAVPYGDLITLLLAFFVVMYAISSVNEGKYRAVADSLNAAFRGAPRAVDPIQVGERKAGTASPSPVMQTGATPGDPRSLVTPISQSAQRGNEAAGSEGEASSSSSSSSAAPMTAMDQVVDQVESSMMQLIEQQMLRVTRQPYGVEIEIRTDILFPSGSATIAPSARNVLEKLADTLKPLPYPMRVEGHTDNRPINTSVFPSNWELSAARAATVVHLFTQRGMDASRLAVIGLGEFRPEADNTSEAGRNVNRRVVLVILSGKEGAESDLAAPREQLTAEALATSPIGATPAAVPTVPTGAPAAPIANAHRDNNTVIPPAIPSPVTPLKPSAISITAPLSTAVTH